jgi:hypothetical protein
MSEAKPTPGEWAVRRSGGDEWYFRDGEMTIVRAGDEYDAIAVMNACPKTEEYFNIFTQALNVREQTGLTPSQLVERVKELEEALRGLDEAYCRAGSPLTREERFEDRKRLIAARAALSKARPNTAEGEAAQLLRQILAASQDGDSDTHLSAHFVKRIQEIANAGGAR